jgi:hypothetical protein
VNAPVIKIFSFFFFHRDFFPSPLEQIFRRILLTAVAVDAAVAPANFLLLLFGSHLETEKGVDGPTIDDGAKCQ